MFSPCSDAPLSEESSAPVPFLDKFLDTRRLLPMSTDLDHIRQVFEEADCLFTRAGYAAIATMAADIEKLHDKNLLVFAVMNGGLRSVVSLTQLHFPLESSYMPPAGNHQWW